jgi:membrane protein required for colicin V production
VNWLDIVIVAIIALSFIGGIAKGFVRAAIGLGATLIGLFCGIWFYGLAVHYFEPYVSSRAIASFLGFLIIFMGIVAVGALIAALLAKLFDIVGLSWLDRLLGGAFGAVRGIVLCVGLVLLVMAFDPKPPAKSVADSRFAPYITGSAEVLSELTPYELKSAFGRSYDRVKEIWQAMLQKDQLRRLPAERI